MSDLSDFLLARIAEDEAMAQAATDAKPGAHYSDASRVGPAWSADDGMVIGEDDLWEDEGADSLRMAAQAAEHIARHDPARVLAECEAKRRIVQAWQADETGPLGEWDDYAWYAIEWAMKALALPYVDHLDYREEWKP